MLLLGSAVADIECARVAPPPLLQALKLKPTYVRALYNLGVSCINIGCLKEAAEVRHCAYVETGARCALTNRSHLIVAWRAVDAQHLLAALAMHGGGNQRNVSVNLWETLQRTLIMMQRQDLLELCAKRDVELFRPHFDF